MISINFSYEFLLQVQFGIYGKRNHFELICSFVVVLKLGDKHILMYLIYKIPLSCLFSYFVLLSLFRFVLII